ncbi:MAG: cupin domain-containing protein [Verrucomicrobia bacterium]|nr:MAG: cupin domain-containing protein [Verrucomicrobiota bacterium]
MKLIKINELPEQGVSHNARIRKRVMLKGGEVGPITSYSRAVFPPGEKAGAHRHDDMTEVFTVESGCGEIRIDDVAYGFSAGVTVVVEPGEVHEIISTGSTELVVTYFGVLVE